MTLGFDNYSINHQLLLALPFTEGTGTVTYDIAKPHHELALAGTPPTWQSLASGYPYIDFDGAADNLQCPAADSADLNFTTEDFTLKAWLYNTGPVLTDSVMCQGVDDVDGWEWYISAGGDITLRTNQAAAHTEVVAATAFTSSVWQLVGIVRDGSAGQFYMDGDPIATTGSLTDPVSVAAADIFYVGAQAGAANFWDGGIAFPEIWERALTASEWKAIFASERHWFGV